MTTALLLTPCIKPLSPAIAAPYHNKEWASWGDDAVEAFYSDRGDSLEESPESMLWQVVLATLPHDIKYAASHSKRPKAEKKIHAILEDARGRRVQEICAVLAIDHDLLVEKLEKLARDLGFAQCI